MGETQALGRGQGTGTDKHAGQGHDTRVKTVKRLDREIKGENLLHFTEGGKLGRNREGGVAEAAPVWRCARTKFRGRQERE